MNQSYNNNNSFYSVFALLIIVFAIIFSWKVTIPSYKDDQAQYNQQNQQTDAAKNKLESLKEVKSDLAANASLVKTIESAVPEGKDIPNLITELEAIAASQKIVIPSIDISDPASNENASSVQVGFTLTGTYTQLSEIVRMLEKDIRFMNITSLNFTNTDSDVMSLAVQLNVYKRDSNALSIANPVTSLSGNTNLSGTGE